jgi:hypothetical protein
LEVALGGPWLRAEVGASGSQVALPARGQKESTTRRRAKPAKDHFKDFMANSVAATLGDLNLRRKGIQNALTIRA